MVTIIDVFLSDLDLDYLFNYVKEFLRILLGGKVTFHDAIQFTIITWTIIGLCLLELVIWFVEGVIYKKVLTMHGVPNPNQAFVPYVREVKLSHLVNKDNKVKLLGKFNVSINVVKASGVLDDLLGLFSWCLAPRIILSFIIYGNILTTIYKSLSNKEGICTVFGYLFSMFAILRIVYFWYLYRRYRKGRL